MGLSLIASETFKVEKYHDLEITVRVNQGHWKWYYSIHWIWFPISVL